MLYITLIHTWTLIIEYIQAYLYDMCINHFPNQIFSWIPNKPEMCSLC